MPKISKDSAPDVQDYGPATDSSGDLDDYTVNFVTIEQTHSLAGMFKGLPGEACPCPHWGYLFAGKITVTYADREEVYQAGDAFYMTPRARARRRGRQRVRPVQSQRGAGRSAGRDDAQRPAARRAVIPGFKFRRRRCARSAPAEDDPAGGRGRPRSARRAARTDG